MPEQSVKLRIPDWIAEGFLSKKVFVRNSKKAISNSQSSYCTLYLSACCWSLSGQISDIIISSTVYQIEKKIQKFPTTFNFIFQDFIVWRLFDTSAIHHQAIWMFCKLHQPFWIRLSESDYLMVTYCTSICINWVDSTRILSNTKPGPVTDLHRHQFRTNTRYRRWVIRIGERARRLLKLPCPVATTVEQRAAGLFSVLEQRQLKEKNQKTYF